MMTLRRRAALVALVATITGELVLIPLNYFFPNSDAVEAATVVLNLPGEIAVALFMIFASGHLPLTGKPLAAILLTAGALISIGSWTALAAFIFRQDRADALSAWSKAIKLDALTLTSLGLFLAAGTWFCIKMAGDGDATVSAITCALALGLVAFARRRSRRA